MPKRINRNKKKEFNLTERFRQLRTNIEFSQYDKNLKVINVVSTIPDEGKSTVSTNLAKTYATQYGKVLLIDCDLRNPTVHKMFGISNKSGLSNLLTHFKDGDNLLSYPEFQKLETGENPFYVLTAGTKVPNPQELLSSKRFQKFINTAKTQFDMIIIDCPPYMAVSDSVPVSAVADGTLYVISTKDTKKSEAREGVNELQRNGANIIGLVLTKAENITNRSYYYNYG